MEINTITADPFSDLGGTKYEKIVQGTHVHIRVTQRTRYKHFTVCEGLPDELNFNKVIRALRKNFSCSVSLAVAPEGGTIIQLQGHHATNLIDFLTITGICLKSNIKVHGV